MGNTGLHIACLAGKLPVVELLIESGADPNSLSQVGVNDVYLDIIQLFYKTLTMCFS